MPETQTVSYHIAIWLERPNWNNLPGNPTDVYSSPRWMGNLDIEKDFYQVATIPMEGVAGTTPTPIGITSKRVIAGMFSPKAAKVNNSEPTALLRFASIKGVDVKPIAEDGSTVINLFAYRKIYTWTFDAVGESNFNRSRTMSVNGRTYGRYGVIEAKFEQDIADMYPHAFGGPDNNTLFSEVPDRTVFNQWVFNGLGSIAENNRPNNGNLNLNSPRRTASPDLFTVDGQFRKFTLGASFASGVVRKYLYYIEAADEADVGKVAGFPVIAYDIFREPEDGSGTGRRFVPYMMMYRPGTLGGGSVIRGFNGNVNSNQVDREDEWVFARNRVYHIEDGVATDLRPLHSGRGPKRKFAFSAVLDGISVDSENNYIVFFYTRDD